MTAPDVDEQRAWLHLSRLPGIGGGTVARLLRAFGGPRAACNASQAQLTAVVGEHRARLLAQPVDSGLIDAALAWAEAPGRRLLFWSDPDFPHTVLEAARPPVVLHLQGHAELLATPGVAVVGSRSPTPQGRDNARNLSRALSLAGVTVISGLAAGIDGAAHEGALEGPGSTIAVLGTGIDLVYPRSHLDLAMRIGEQGLLLSEFPLGTPPAQGNFPRRNRLIAGLGRACLVVEAGLRSGSLITARLAAEMGREVLAIPGSIHNPLARGCHRLIRDGARLVETLDDILGELPPAPPPGQAPSGTEAPETPSTEAETLLGTMGFDPTDLDELCRRSGLTPDRLSSMLLALELSGHIDALPGGRYQRRNS